MSRCFFLDCLHIFKTECFLVLEQQKWLESSCCCVFDNTLKIARSIEKCTEAFDHSQIVCVNTQQCIMAHWRCLWTYTRRTCETHLLKWVPKCLQVVLWHSGQVGSTTSCQNMNESVFICAPSALTCLV
jgi:hypothetical protein